MISPHFGERLSKIKNYGIGSDTEVNEIGPNAKMNEIAKRKRIDARYRELLGDIKGIRLNENGGNSESNHAYFPIVVNEEFPCTRDELYEKLLSSDIAAGRRFYPLATSFKCFQGEFDTIETPVAKEISEQVLLMPTVQTAFYGTIPQKRVLLRSNKLTKKRRIENGKIGRRCT